MITKIAYQSARKSDAHIVNLSSVSSRVFNRIDKKVDEVSDFR